MPDTTSSKIHLEITTTDETIEKADGFAQVFPEHKFNIVSILQKNNSRIMTASCCL